MMYSNYGIKISVIISSMMAASTNTLQLILITVLKIIFEQHAGKVGLWTPGRLGSGRMDSASLTLGRLDSGRLGAWTLDAWNLDSWTQDDWAHRLWTFRISTTGS